MSNDDDDNKEPKSWDEYNREKGKDKAKMYNTTKVSSDYKKKYKKSKHEKETDALFAGSSSKKPRNKSKKKKKKVTVETSIYYDDNSSSSSYRGRGRGFIPITRRGRSRGRIGRASYTSYRDRGGTGYDSRERGRGRGRGRSSRATLRGRGGGRAAISATATETASKKTVKKKKKKNKKKVKGLKTKTIETKDGKKKKIIIAETIGTATEELLAKQEWKPDDKELIEIKKKFEGLNAENIQQILLGQDGDINTVQDHIYCIKYNGDKYISHIDSFIKFKVMATLSIASKSKILVGLIICGEKEMIDKLLYFERKKKVNINYYSVPEIAKVIQLLDAPRLTRQYLKEVQKFEDIKYRKHYNPIKNKKKLLMLKNKIYNLQKDGDGLHSGSLSGAKQKFFAKWIKSIDSNILSFFLLNFPKTNWKYICDLIHTNPEKDFPEKMSFFQNVIFNKNDGDDEKLMDKESLVYNAKRVNRDNLVELLTKYPYLSQCYSYLRTRILINPHDVLPDKAKLILSQYAPLPDLLWWFDEFEMESNAVENKICDRLKNSDDKLIFIDDGSNKSNYGKLMERLLKFLEERRRFAPLLIDHVQKKLYTIPRITDIFRDKKYEFRIAIFGDASASMNVAIRTASILSSLMSYALCADLLFFNSEPFDPPVIPRNVDETISVVTKVKGSGTTSMASALYPYYINKIKVDLFILVSDEGENRRYRGYYFAELFNLYRNEINKKTKLFLVSFLHQSINGLIMTRCIAKGIDKNDIKQIRLHPINPDTSKFDGLLGIAGLMLSSLAKDNDNDSMMNKLPYIQENIFNVLFNNISSEIIEFQNDYLCEQISGLIYDFLRGLPNKSVLKLGVGFGNNLDSAFSKNINNKKKDKEELDLVFCLDCTSSMGSYIKKAKEAIKSIVSDINKNNDVNVQFGYIAYRDHPPQDSSFVYKIYPFTSSTQEMIKYISSHGASGGGDLPEAVTAGLNAAINDKSDNKLNWRACSVRILVLIADAPPHGLGGSSYDRIPNGDPNGLDPIKVARNLAENGIVLYVVACEPSLSQIPRAHDLMAGLAKITEGSFLPLTSAKLLPDIIIGGAAQEISLQKLTKNVQNEYNENIKRNFQNLINDNNWNEIYKQISIGLNFKNIKYSKFEIDDIYGKYNTINIDKCVYSENIKEWKQEYENINQPNINYSNIKEQTTKSKESKITIDIVKTVMNRLLNQW